MKMKEIIPTMNQRIYKTEYLNLDVSVAEKRHEYCRKQSKSGRKDHYKIYEEARRKFK